MSGPVLGALIGFAGALIGSYASTRRAEQKELREFYSFVASLLSRLFESGEADRIQRVAEDLTADVLHYNFGRLWTRIPEQSNGIRIKSLLFQFLKGGARLQVIEQDKDYHDLFDWLKKAA